MIIPPLLRAIDSAHRTAITHVFGNLQPKPEWTPPDLDVLFLCFTNRCGSNYLGYLLASTGAFNEAGEFFNSSVVLMHAAARGLRSLPEYFSALPTLVPHRGRIAAKASIDQLVMLADAGILDALRGRATYLLLERRDPLAQAISRTIAWQNGRWTTAQEANVPDSALVFDHAAIELEMAMIAYDNAAFSLFFAANEIVPVRITYEALLADAGLATTAVGAAMGLPGLCAQPDKVPIARQSNAINAAWRAQYLAGPAFGMEMLPGVDPSASLENAAAHTRKTLKHLLRVAVAKRRKDRS